MYRYSTCSPSFHLCFGWYVKKCTHLQLYNIFNISEPVMLFKVLSENREYNVDSLPLVSIYTAVDTTSCKCWKLSESLTLTVLKSLNYYIMKYSMYTIIEPQYVSLSTVTGDQEQLYFENMLPFSQLLLLYWVKIRLQNTVRSGQSMSVPNVSI